MPVAFLFMQAAKVNAKWTSVFGATPYLEDLNNRFLPPTDSNDKIVENLTHSSFGYNLAKWHSTRDGLDIKKRPDQVRYSSNQST